MGNVPQSRGPLRIARFQQTMLDRKLKRLSEEISHTVAERADLEREIARLQKEGAK